MRIFTKVQSAVFKISLLGFGIILLGIVVFFFSLLHGLLIIIAGILVEIAAMALSGLEGVDLILEELRGIRAEQRNTLESSEP